MRCKVCKAELAGQVGKICADCNRAKQRAEKQKQNDDEYRRCLRLHWRIA